MKVGRESSWDRSPSRNTTGGLKKQNEAQSIQAWGRGSQSHSVGQGGPGSWFSLSAKESHWRLWGRDMMCADLHSRGHFAGGEHLMGTGGSQCGSPGQTG